MKVKGLGDFDLLDFGNEIQLSGALYSGKGMVLAVPLPDEDGDGLKNALEACSVDVLSLDAPAWEALLRQTDLLNIATGPKKAIVRKAQRQIDSKMSWDVFRRDGFKCRYCGGEKPLTVDHVDLWTEGGTTVVDNLVSACRDCNRTRGERPYEEWLQSDDYRKRSSRIPQKVKDENLAVVNTLPMLRARRVPVQRSR